MEAGKINEQVVTLISYHALNMGQACFFRSMLEVVVPHVVGQVILGGDSNASLEQVLDKSNPNKVILKHAPKQSSRIVLLLHSYDLIDIWRDTHPPPGTIRSFPTCIKHIVN